ncbi:hypothetical protein VNO77_30403 [Canavalia gladiata]|uniref:Uncharacterized protein n=1 Tax=Canavalia gladiata TaxID=3824 RepID=A0AAN9KQ84_CANGL
MERLRTSSFEKKKKLEISSSYHKMQPSDKIKLHHNDAAFLCCVIALPLLHRYATVLLGLRFCGSNRLQLNYHGFLEEENDEENSFTNVAFIIVCNDLDKDF